MLGLELDNLSRLKREFYGRFKDIEKRIHAAQAELEERYITDFVRDQENATKALAEEINEQRAQAMAVRESMMKSHADMARLKHTERLMVTTTLLEDHLTTQKAMDNELALLKQLGQEDELLSQLATTLEHDLDTKRGLDTPQTLHAECDRVISQAKLAALVDRKGVLGLLQLVELRQVLR
jgi:hypothetical protein